jgi:AcrR family transcriptional regulator
LTGDLTVTYNGDRKVTVLFEEAIMANVTKERILEAALQMFSQNGYAGTNIRELSASLGLVKSGVYKHYESKEAIWNALLDQMIAYYGERFGSPEHLPPVPETADELVALTMRMVNITVHDEKIIMTRKVLTLEQYRDKRACELATKHFLTGLTEMFTRIFAGMMEKGVLCKDDPEMLAFAYTAPISALIHLCDREPEKTEEAIARVEAFSRHFVRTYGRNAE